MSLPSSPSKPAVMVRPATADDLPALVGLLRERDEREHPSQAVEKYLFDLDPRHIVAWLVTVDGQPAALNTIYLRELGWGSESVRAGYWAHLYVSPKHRKLMIYPQLVAAMLRATREIPLDAIYTATRRLQVAQSHEKLGFRLLSTLAVPMKPLRPARLLAKRYQASRLVEFAGAPIDGLWQMAQRWRFRALRTDAIVEPLPWDNPDVGEVVALFNAAGGNRIHMRWDLETLRRRFAGTIEGWPYSLFVARDPKNCQIVGATLLRIAERGQRAIRAAVLMNLVTAPNHLELAPILLAKIDRFALANDAEVILALDGAEKELKTILAEGGYRSSPETYNLLVWPKTKVTPEAFASQIDNWRFTFADHDAF